MKDTTHEAPLERPADEDARPGAERTERRERTTDGDGTETEAASAYEAVVDACIECGETIVTDRVHGERVCEGCGLVVSEGEIDHAAELGTFRWDGSDGKVRVGAPTSARRHDRGLSTTIDWRNRDSAGNEIGSHERQRMLRIRLWNRRLKTEDSRERGLRQALGEIDRMASALELPADVRETASVVYRRAHDNDLLPGRSLESMATAALYAAARQSGVPRSIDEMTAVSRIDERKFRRSYRYLVRELGLAVQQAMPEQYVRRYVSELGLSMDVERVAAELLESARDEGLHAGKSPVTLAAAAVYAAGVVTGERVTQDRVAAVTDVSDVTIRTRYRELLAASPYAGARPGNGGGSTATADDDDE